MAWPHGGPGDDNRGPRRLLEPGRRRG
jgi:hypothetical protein